MFSLMLDNINSIAPSRVVTAPFAININLNTNLLRSVIGFLDVLVGIVSVKCSDE